MRGIAASVTACIGLALMAGTAVGEEKAVSGIELDAHPTDPTKFYNAADGTQLQQAFRDIAIKLSSLYLSK